MIKFLIIFLSLNVFAQDQMHLYSTTVLGERDFDLYFGPNDPLVKRGGIGESDQFLDDYFRKDYLREFSTPSVFDLLDFIADELPRMSMCPNYYLGKNTHSMRFLFRLLSLSYLFENLKSLKIASYNLGFGDICSLEWEDTFQKCRATEPSMANFVKRIKGNHLKDFSNKELIKMKNQERDKWLKDFHGKAKGYKDLDLAQSRILYFCKSNNLDCQTISLEDLKFAFQLSCTEDQNLLLNICSNSDQLYGLSYVKGAPKLIEDSNAFGKLDEEGFGDNCLKRFVNVYREKEIKNSLFSVIFPKVEALMVKEKRAYKQGSLFVYGTLEEFDVKGLEGFLFSPNEPQPKIEKNEPMVVQKEASLPKEEAVSSKGLLEIVTSLKNLSKIDIYKNKKIKTQFIQTSMTRFMKDSEKEPINMDLFKKEAVFHEEIGEALLERIDIYCRKTSFQKLRDTESFGTNNSPFPLTFLKFLIDNNDQQSLNNLLEVIGDKFYVINDLEEAKKVYFIQLKRESDRWQIYIHKPEKESAPKFK